MGVGGLFLFFSGYILKLEAAEFPDEMGIRYKGEIKDDLKIFSQRQWKDQVVIN